MNFNELSINEIIDHLNANLGKLSEKDQGFASSLLESVARYGRPSEKQAYWLRVLADRTVQKRETVEIGSLEGISALFDRAAASMKRPAILVADADMTYRLSLAGPTASVPGSINVTTNQSFENRTWFGRILPNGQFQASPRQTAPAGLVDVLRRFSADPAGVAAQYGRETGSCCFCARDLTDGRYIHVGYGPICADRYGLPWGEKKQAA